MGEAGKAASCPSCGLVIQRGSTRRLHLTVRNGGVQREVPVATLVDRMEALGGAWSRATDGAGSLCYRAAARLRVAGTETPVRYQGRLLGFAERFGAGTPGTLEVRDESLSFHHAESGTPTARDAVPLRSWALESLRSLQASSSSVQLTTEGGGLLLFRFDNDSTRRWESLLRGAIATRWEALGRGRVVEFQPRILADGAAAHGIATDERTGEGQNAHRRVAARELRHRSGAGAPPGQP
jgi:hypothetical protein